VEALSSTFHRRLLCLLAGRAIIEGVNSLAGPTRALGQGRRIRAWTRTAAGTIIAAALILPAAACGGSSGAHVAQLGSTAAQITSNSSTAQVNGAVAFSRCVRSRGIPAYPDPSTAGLPPKKTPQQLGVSSAEFQAAQTACQHLLVNGGRPTQAEVQQYRNTMLVYARCIRANGVTNMPDPDSRGHLNIGPGSDVNVDSPQFQAAYQRCKSKLSP
jgi:hypothetical protein